MTASRTVRLLDAGRAPYGPVHRLQKRIHAAVADGRDGETWIVVEHEPVITLGRDGKAANVRSAADDLARRGIDVVRVERGGDVTYHGPGQVVVYPIMKLMRFREIVPLVTALEAALIEAVASFGIVAGGRPEHRGVYVGDRAIGAVGLAVQRMTTLHGVALNVATSLDYDRLITPCGTPQFGVTSIEREAGRPVAWSAGRDALLAAFERVFDVRFAAESATALWSAAS